MVYHEADKTMKFGWPVGKGNNLWHIILAREESHYLTHCGLRFAFFGDIFKGNKYLWKDCETCLSART
jgi:hypothetical protein